MTSRRKGRYYENEFARRFGGRRISETGMPGPDVAISHHGKGRIPRLPDVLGKTVAFGKSTWTFSTRWEVKYRETIAVLNWWDQTLEEGADYLAIRRSGDKQWYIIHPVTQPCPCPLKDQEGDV